MIRRLTVKDVGLLREAWNWDHGRPSWYVAMDSVFNGGTVDDFIESVEHPATVAIGVFDPLLTAIVIIEHHGSGLFEGHLMAKRGASPAVLVTVIEQLLHDLLDYGLTEACCWIAEKNRSVRKLCANIGFQPDGVSMYKGAYRGRVIRWLRYSIQREQLTAAKAA